MKFLADENFPGVALRMLLGKGLDFKVIPRTMQGTADVDLLAYAKRENRVLVTLDKDFGELIFKSLHGTVGVVFFRLPDLPAPDSMDRIVTVLSGPTEFAGRFTTVDDNKIRTRILG